MGSSVSHTSKNARDHLLDLIRALLNPTFRNSETAVDTFKDLSHESQPNEPQVLGLNIHRNSQGRGVHHSRPESDEPVRRIADSSQGHVFFGIDSRFFEQASGQKRFA